MPNRSRSPKTVAAHNLKTTRSGALKRRNLLWRARRLLFLGAVLLIAGVAGFALVLSQIELPGPPPDEEQTTFICDASVARGECSRDTALAELHGEEDRVYVDLEEIPDVMAQAVLAAEDQDFFDHGGVDPVGISRAAWADITSTGIRQGGSTITQQYIKNVYLNNDRTLTRKLKEAVMAVKFEQQYSKSEILERYLNTVYFGRGAYGVQAAARSYFGKDVSEVTLPEAALLAGLIRAPVEAEPYRYPEVAKRRRASVLDNMVEEGHITPEQATFSKKWPFDPFHGLALWAPGDSIEVLKGGDPGDPESFSSTEYFVEHVRKQLVRRYGERMVYGGGLRVYTTIDLDMQKAAYDAVTSILDRSRDPAGALVAVDDTGQIRAMMGGEDFDQSQVNLATGVDGGGTGRQPGSTFKPFALAEAVREGYSIESRFRAPSEITLPNANAGEDWTVTGGCCGGTTTLLDATENSVNTVFAQLMVDLGPQRVTGLADQMGVTADLPNFPSVVLGSGEVSVLDMASGYSTLANQGTRITPRAVVRVERADGSLVEEFNAEGEPVLTPDEAGKVTYGLRQVVQSGTGTAADLGIDQAGKTGTTQDNKDAWFVGYTPRLTAAVWMGYPGIDGPVSPMTSVHGQTVTGGNFPAQMWRAFMGAVTAQGFDTGTFPEPPDNLYGGEDLNPELGSPRRESPSEASSSESDSSDDGASSDDAADPTRPSATEPPATEPPATEPLAAPG